MQGAPTELKQAVHEFGNHALAINLLAEYLHQFPMHSVQQLSKIPKIDVPVEKGKYPRRVIAAFAEQFTESSAEFELLSVLGLFDRPAEKIAIDAIIKNTPIPGLTEKLSKIKTAGWLNLLDNLRKYKLIAKKSEHRPETLDCHPLIREHFGEKLQTEKAKAWQQAHARLYEYYKNLPEKELPDTLEEMEPLFAAVRYGCLAGRHQEAMDDVFFKRIKRSNDHFIWYKLGAFGADLACLSSFFESPWDKPVSDLRDVLRAATLNWAGFNLRAVGRLQEAIQPMKAGLKMRIKQKNWKESAIDATNLSELLLTLGDVKVAEKYAKQSVEFADRSGDGFQKDARRSTLAIAFYQAGRMKDAEALFIEAENMQKKRQPEYPYLYSLRGFQYCDLLISLGRYEKVLERAKKALEIALGGSRKLLDIALNKLSIGKALMLQSIQQKSAGFSEAENFLNEAVDGLREYSNQGFIPWGLFARAILCRHQNNFSQSWADLDEAREIAEYGKMRLHLTDYFLEACRNFRSQLSVVRSPLFHIIENGGELSLSKPEMEAKFREFLAKVDQLVTETGYHRRDGELEELK